MANTSRNKPQANNPQGTPTQDFNPMLTLQARYERNKKRINTIITVILLVIIGGFAYFKLYRAPQEKKAAAAITYAQRYFEADSLDKALNGDGQHSGFLKVMKKYSGTPTANLCHYYAGVCYLQKGDFKNAIKYLEDFDGEGTMLQYAAWGAMGDAYMESNNVKKGIEYYNKASGDANDIVYTPLYLYRAGMAYEIANQPEDAKKAYLRIRDEFPQSIQAREVDRNLARLGVLD